ncbi:CUGBP Elav-like family member 1-A isoform X1 [Drosophila guanche]|nr:CUGBP Elav-like family member 1-A isoform X1 [Drosophila guanche]
MMLQSLNLHADTLSSIPAGTVATAAEAVATETTNEAAATPATTMLTTTPVALIANGNNSSNSNGNSNNILYNNNNLNNNNNCNVQQQQQTQQQQLQQQQSQQQQLQLHPQPVKYLENLTSSGPTSGAIAATTTFTGAAKSFHPYLRHNSNTNSSNSLLPALSTTATAATTKMSTALLETLLHNQINSSTTAATLQNVPAAAQAAQAVPAATIPTAAAAATTATTAEAAAATAAATSSQLNSGINSRSSLVDHSLTVAAAAPAISAANRLSSPMEDDLKPDLDVMDTNGNEMLKDQPDADNIKMFVGQIPKTWDETRLRQMFEQFGPVHTLNVLRDKVTSISRGCCFVTYYTRKAALRAQDALHNIKTLDGMHHPIQMKPADSENRNERKLFVGMLNKKYTEADVRQLFTGHGTIEECTVLRDQAGQSKGCAFVTFATKQNAIGAIKSLHQSQTMEGCSAPLVVKFADTQKEKDQKKMQQLHAFCGINALTSQTPSGASAAANTPTANTATALIAAPPTAARPNPSMAAALAAVPPVQQAGSGTQTALVSVPTSAQLNASLAPTLLGGNPHQGAAAAAAAAAAYLGGDPAAAAHLQLYQQLHSYGLSPAHYLPGLNFHPPDNSATHHSQHGPPGVGTTSVGAAAAANLSAAAAAAASTAPLSLGSGGPSSSAASLGGGGGSGSSIGLPTAGHAPSAGLLAAPSLSMQNLVTLLASAPSPHQQHHHQHPLTIAPNNNSNNNNSSSNSNHSIHNIHNHPATSSSSSSSIINQRQQQHSLIYAQPGAGSSAAQLLQHPYSMSQLMPQAHQSSAGQTLSLNALWTTSASDPYSPALSGLTNGSVPGAAYGVSPQSLNASALQAAAAGVAGKQIEGPDGSNLFIYHLPQEFIDTDLASTFLPFGNVLSAKVFIDKQTNLSKCFGFVSYDNPHSANAAIQAMHGFQIGTKRLKVQLKRSKDAAKPY